MAQGTAKPSKKNLPDRSITLGGKRLTIKFGVRALEALRELWGFETDSQVQKKIADAGDNTGIVVDMLWAATRTYHPEISRDDMLDMCDKAGVEGMGEAVQEALEASQPPPSAKKKPVTTTPSR